MSIEGHTEDREHTLRNTFSEYQYIVYVLIVPIFKVEIEGFSQAWYIYV